MQVKNKQFDYMLSEKSDVIVTSQTYYILIVANSISRMGIKMIYWSWVIGDVTKIPDLSYYI